MKNHHLHPRPVQQPRPPLIIGGGGKRVLRFAGRVADIVSINVNLKGGTAGPEVVPDATPARTREKVEWVRQAAGDRFDKLELNCLIGFVLQTDDRRSIVDSMAPALGLDPSEALHVPLALVGTIDEMEEELYVEARELRIVVLLLRELVLGGDRRARRTPRRVMKPEAAF